MARIAGVNIPTGKPVGIALTYIYGIGRDSARKICASAGVDPAVRTQQLSESELIELRGIIDRDYNVEGELRREVSLSIKRLTDLGCFRGIRHRTNLPVRGQRTRTNARTRKARPRRPFVRKG